MDHSQEDGEPSLEEAQEWVLLIPPKLAQSTYRILVKSGCVSRPWHLQGRYGSRTHHYKESIGIPILDVALVTSKAKTDPELERLLETEGVEMVRKAYTRSNREQPPRPFDARIHPERAPPSSSDNNNKPSMNVLAQSQQQPPSFTYAELFAGIGGFGVALEALGGTCVFASEMEPACRDVYALNFPNATLHGDIYQVSNDQLPKWLDLLVGGFPCQPFSALGQQPGLQCPKGHLFREIVRVLQVSKPKAFLLENVQGLMDMKETLDTILKALEQAGYTVSIEVINARCLAATSRKRLFFVGLQHGLQPFEFPYIPDLGLRAHDVIDYNLQDDMLHVTDSQLDVLCNGKRFRPADLAWPHTVCRTLVSHYGNSIGRGNSQLVPCRAPLNPRRFSPRECARLMGFPNTFRLLSLPRQHQGEMAFLKEQYRMLGNAVVPPLIAALAGAVLAHVCPDLPGDDWVKRGRTTAIKLAYEATLTGIPSSSTSS